MVSRATGGSSIFYNKSQPQPNLKLWQAQSKVLGVFSKLLSEKKIKIFLYFFEESFFSDMTPLYHLLDVIEED